MSGKARLIGACFLAGLLLCGGMQPADRQERHQEFQGLLQRAAALRAQGEFEGSLSFLGQAFSMSGQDQLSESDKGNGLILMGILSWDLGNIAESARHFLAAQAAFERAGDSASRGKCANFIELVRLYEKGKDDRQARLLYRSIERFEASLSLAREIGILDFQLKCLRQQSLTYLDLRKLDLFLENNQRGLDIATEINHRIEQGRCLNNIGVYYQQCHRYSQAVANFERALSISRAANDRTTETECLNNLGLVYRELGNLDLAEYYLSRALSLDEKTGSVTSICMDLENLGSIYLSRGIEGRRMQDLLQALEMLQKSLRLMDHAEGDSLAQFAALNNLGIVLNELKRHEEARRLLVRAMDIVKADQYALERGQVLNNIATTYLDEQSIDQAIAYYSRSMEIGTKGAFYGVLMESGLGLGRCYDLKNDGATALSYYRRSIDALEQLRARISSEPFMIGFARNKFGAYERAIDILADQNTGRPAEGITCEIFDLIERAKARSFLESVYEARIEIAESDVSSLIERQKAISENISRLTSRLAGRLGSKQEERDLKDEVELEEGEYLRIVSELRRQGGTREERWRKTVSGVRDIQRMLLSDESVLLEYFLGPQRSYLIVVSPRDLKMHILPPQGGIESSLRGYLKWASDPTLDVTSGQGPSERIERELIPSDSNGTVLKAKAVIVIPDGILHRLPFESLTVRDGSGSRYLIEHTAVSYCPSASALALLRSSTAPAHWKKQLLAIGGPDYRPKDRGNSSVSRLQDGLGGDEIRPSPLPFSRREVLDIARLFPPQSADILAGEEANESRLRRTALGDYRMIHFACHGSVDERFPSRSALVLSPERGPENDGLLQMREIYGMTMNADMVVLSACETARGALERSEGSMGLARPFFFAGARAVIASLWQVNDKATVVFMRELYGNLIEGRSASEALRSAKIKMLRSPWEHPFYWASFMLQGDPCALGAAK